MRQHPAFRGSQVPQVRRHAEKNLEGRFRWSSVRSGALESEYSRDDLVVDLQFHLIARNFETEYAESSLEFQRNALSFRLRERR